MKTKWTIYAALEAAVCVFLLGVSLTACAASGNTWSEEVLLHDGKKLTVKRSQSYGGLSEPGQSGPIREHSISFKLPGSERIVSWTSEYGQDLGRTNFNLLAVHLLRGTPYVIASPNLCLSYNKWGRPNPPYVIFKYARDQWQRISLEMLPLEFKTINVVLSIQKPQADELSATGLVSAERIKELNSGTEIPEYKQLLRTPVLPERCPQFSNGPRAPRPIGPDRETK